MDMDSKLLVVFRSHGLNLFTTIFGQHRLIRIGVGHGQQRLINIEEHTDFSVMHAFVLLLFFFWQGKIVLTRNDVLWIMTVDVLTPVVPIKGYAFLVLPYTLSTVLRIVVEGVQVCLIAVAVGIQSHHKGIERTYRNAFGIELRHILSCCIEPVTFAVSSITQRTCNQFHLALRCILFL